MPASADEAAQAVLVDASSAANEVAQADPTANEPPTVLFQPQSWHVGPFSVTPRLGTTAGSNDNITLAPSAAVTPSRQAPVASGFVTWTPELAVTLAGDNTDRYDLSLRGELTRYVNRSNNNTDNLEVGLDGLNLIGASTALAWRVLAQDWHDPVGSTDLSLDSSDPDHFRAQALGALLRHDSDDDAARTEGEATVSRKRYLNHRDITLLGDVDTRSLALRHLRIAWLGEKVMTRWLAEARGSVATYPSDIVGLTPLNNTDTRFLAGLQWEPIDPSNASSSGAAKLGLQRKLFRGARPHYAGMTWDVAQHWQPRTRTQWDFNTSRAASDAPGDDSNEVVVRQETLAWTELWRADLRSTITVHNGDHRYHYSASAAQVARHDRVHSVELGLRFDLRENLEIGFNLSVAQRHSSAPLFDYKRHVNSLILQVAL